MPLRLSLRPQRGFTLIELLVAISIMALMAVLSWRGLDSMARTQAQLSQRADEVLTLQAGLAQWKLDLDMLSATPNVTPLDWDGRVLRLTRRTAVVGDGLQVVAWTRRNDGRGQWLLWHMRRRSSRQSFRYTAKVRGSLAMVFRPTGTGAAGTGQP